MKKENVEYYEGMLDGTSACAKMMSAAAKELTENNKIPPNLIVGKTAEAMIELMDNTRNIIRNIKEDK